VNIQCHWKKTASVLAGKRVLTKTKGRRLILCFSLQNEITVDGNDLLLSFQQFSAALQKVLISCLYIFRHKYHCYLKSFPF